MARQTVAAVIPTKNSAKVIRGALESLWFCDEVIVVDMHSEDATPAICRSYPNVRFFQKEGYIYGNFNFGMDQARSDWIIRLDSDERISIDLQNEIMKLLADPPKCDAYTAPFVSYFVGFPMENGPAEEKGRRMTLFRKTKLRYQVRSEHEDLTPVAEAPSIGKLEHMYIHFSTPSISKFIKKIDYYSEKDCDRVEPSTVKVLPPWRLCLAAARHFFRYYIVKGGHRDGYAGFALCALNACYLVIHNLKLWEKKEQLKKFHDKVRDDYDANLAKNRHAKQAPPAVAV
jgi:glycosyltransferase involved in cell wall biosynthesis